MIEKNLYMTMTFQRSNSGLAARGSDYLCRLLSRHGQAPPGEWRRTNLTKMECSNILSLTRPQNKLRLRPQLRH